MRRGSAFAVKRHSKASVLILECNCGKVYVHGTDGNQVILGTRGKRLSAASSRT